MSIKVSKYIFDNIGKYHHITDEIKRTFRTEEIYLDDFYPLDIEEEDREQGLKERVSFWCPASFSIHGVKYYIQTEAVAWIYGECDFEIELNSDMVDIRTYDNDKAIDRFSNLYDIIAMVTDFWTSATWEWCVDWWQSFDNFEHETEEKA